MDNFERFKNAIKNRSNENHLAMQLLLDKKLYSLLGSIIRMELDSLIRICYIKSLSDVTEKNTLLTQFFDGQRWKLEKSIISDRKMITYVTNNLGLGWADPIYDIGCAFIHLSPFHDYMSQNPTSTLSLESRQTIVKHVKDHHHIDMDIRFTFNDLIRVAPLVFKKLRDNLLHEIK